MSPAMLSFLDFYVSQLDPDVLSETVVPFLLDAATDANVAMNDKVVALRTVEAACEKAADKESSL
jgi:hypothetical protein